jgi:hypothetical protein
MTYQIYQQKQEKKKRKSNFFISTILCFPLSSECPSLSKNIYEFIIRGKPRAKEIT